MARGAARLFEHNFPVDGEYLFQIQLSRNRDGQIEGVNEPHDLELSLDGERLQLFSLKPNRAARGNSERSMGRSRLNSTRV